MRTLTWLSRCETCDFSEQRSVSISNTSFPNFQHICVREREVEETTQLQAHTCDAELRILRTQRLSFLEQLSEMTSGFVNLRRFDSRAESQPFDLKLDENT